MRLFALLALAAAASNAYACTFMMSAQYHSNAGDGSVVTSSSIVVLQEDTDEPYNVEGTIVASGDATLGEACDVLEFHTGTWEFCHSTLDPFGPGGGDYITIQQTDNTGHLLSIYPDGDDKGFEYYGPFSSLVSHYFWRKGIIC
ncbi:hypothetical protein FQN54_003034 [Arachnomyces sp. PD_36]|nr:hypothetical protein FQN54_003034 [Arachnomyces sp. PD_36]